MRDVMKMGQKFESQRYIINIFIPLKNYRQRKLRNFTTDNILFRFSESDVFRIHEKNSFFYQLLITKVHNFKKNWGTTGKILVQNSRTKNIKCRNVYWTSTFINTSTIKKKKKTKSKYTRFSPWKIGLLKIKLCSRIHFGLLDYNGNLHNQLYLFNEQPPPADVREKDRQTERERERNETKSGHGKRERENPLLDTGGLVSHYHSSVTLRI